MFIFPLPLLLLSVSLAQLPGRNLADFGPPGQQLNEDARCLAVYHPNCSEETAETLGMEALALPGWWLQDLQNSQDSAQTAAEWHAQGVFTAPVFRDPHGHWAAPSATVLLRLDAGTEIPALVQEAPEVLAVEPWGGFEHAFKIRLKILDGRQVMDWAWQLGSQPGVLASEPDVLFSGHSNYVPTDPNYGSQWFHDDPDGDLDTPDAWEYTRGDPQIMVGIIDVGVELDHPDLNTVPGADLTSDGPGDGSPVNNCDNHGTPVAGVVSMRMNNGVGGSGVAPDSPSMPLRTFISTVSCNGGWNSFASWTVNALAYAESQGVRVSNNSNWYGFTSSTIDQKYDDTRTNGMVHFGIAGNGASATVVYPGSLPSVNALAAMDSNGNRASFSSWGPGLAFSGPGQDIYTTDRQGIQGWTGSDFTFAWGTSFASPCAAGIAAMLLSIDRTLTPAQVESFMQAGCVDLGAPGYDTDYGWGYVNAMNSLQQLGSLQETMILRGPTSILAGTMGTWDWLNGPPNGNCKVLYGNNIGPTILMGHEFNIGLPFTQGPLQTLDMNGAASLSATVPSSMAGTTLLIEVGAMDGSGTVYDSNLLFLSIQ